jgi:hypothetical protein
MGQMSLAAILEQRARMDPERAVAIIIACCRILDRADPRGVMAPYRIQIADDDEVSFGEFEPQASDFGYISPEEIGAVIGTGARFGHTRHSQTSGVIHPTPGRPPLGGERAAVFALGVILWEMLMGCPLFRGRTDYDTLLLAQDAIVTPPAAPPALAAITIKALARDADVRYPTVQAFVEALERYLAS